MRHSPLSAPPRGWINIILSDTHNSLLLPFCKLVCRQNIPHAVTAMSMTWWKTAVSPVRLQWRYCSLALSYRHAQCSQWRSCFVGNSAKQPMSLRIWKRSVLNTCHDKYNWCQWYFASLNCIDYFNTNILHLDNYLHMMSPIHMTFFFTDLFYWVVFENMLSFSYVTVLEKGNDIVLWYS